MIFLAASRRTAFLYLTALMVTLGFTMGDVLPPYLRTDVAAADHKAIRVATWNTEFWDQEEGRDAFHAMIRSIDADVLLLQEHLNETHILDYFAPIDRANELKSCCGYSYVWAQGELVIASRFPGKVLPRQDGSLFSVQVDVNGEKVKIINTHIPVHISIARSPFSSNFWQFSKEQWSARRHVLDKIVTNVEDTEMPLILGGDFNSTLIMQDFRSSILSRFKTSPEDHWPGNFRLFDFTPSPHWRLDYLLASDQIDRDCYLGSIRPLSASDHQPLICNLVGL